MTATFALSGTNNAGAPPKASTARTFAPIQSGNVSVQVASA